MVGVTRRQLSELWVDVGWAHGSIRSAVSAVEGLTEKEEDEGGTETCEVLCLMAKADTALPRERPRRRSTLCCGDAKMTCDPKSCASQSKTKRRQ